MAGSQLLETVEYHVSPASFVQEIGPCIQVVVREIHGMALLDTGAATTSMDIGLAESLGLRQDETHDVIGATGRGTYPRFRVDLYIPMLRYTVPSPIHGLPLRETGHPWDAVIGRDVLCQYELTINGKTGLIRFTSIP